MLTFFLVAFSAILTTAILVFGFMIVIHITIYNFVALHQPASFNLIKLDQKRFWYCYFFIVAVLFFFFLFKDKRGGNVEAFESANIKANNLEVLIRYIEDDKRSLFDKSLISFLCSMEQNRILVHEIIDNEDHWRINAHGPFRKRSKVDNYKHISLQPAFG